MNNSKYNANNKGLSLVELIIAISIGVIISGAIAAIMSFAIKAYRDSNANVAAQYELQTNINQMMDTIMGANCIIIQSKEADSSLLSDTHYAAFGKFDGSSFDGTVFVAGNEFPGGSGRFNIYMTRGTWTGSTALAAITDTTNGPVKTIEEKMSTEPNPYLLGEGATQFKITMNSGLESDGYTNPLSVRLELKFEKDATGHKIEKRVEDIALIRNKISTDIYIDGTAHSLKKE